MRIEFDKMEGAGNDFILIDNRTNTIPQSDKKLLATTACRRCQGIGADGIIFIQNDPKLDFAWDFYNSDGSQAEMCGNGARCAAKFAHKIGAASTTMTFNTIAGPIHAQITPRGARIALPDITLPQQPETIEADGKPWKLWFLTVGVPHVVVPVPDVEQIDVSKIGRHLRRHPRFSPAGTNVNFFAKTPGTALKIRTYERGVEDETLACGTGSTATGLIAGLHFGTTSPATLQTKGGEELLIHFTLAGNQAKDIRLEGGANLVFSGYFEH